MKKSWFEQHISINFFSTSSSWLKVIHRALESWRASWHQYVARFLMKMAIDVRNTCSLHTIRHWLVSQGSNQQPKGA
jgi:hypothetical protein